MKKSGTVIRGRQSDSPAPRHLPLVDILVDTQAELQELVVASGLKVLEAMLEEDRVAVWGAAVCASARAARLSGGPCPQRSRPGRSQSCGAPAARAARRP